MDDIELLRAYAGSGSQDAFRQLVERHLPMVYSTARRIIHDSHLAEEVAQTVFSTLAQKAKSIGPRQVVGGWLYNTTRYLAMNAARAEHRRRKREETAFTMRTSEPGSEDVRIAEHLEPAMARLDSEDRDALVLRYLQNRNLREVGAELGISEEAARKRVNRALERLRLEFERQGIAVSAVCLASAITASTTALPIELGAAIATGVSGSTAVAGTGIVVSKAITLIELQKTLITAAAIAMIGAGIYGVWQTGVLRTQNRTLLQQHASLTEEIQQLNSERDGTTRQLAGLRSQNNTLIQDTAELLKLRGEVARLRGESQALADLKARNAQKANKLTAIAAVLITNMGPQTVSHEQVRASIHIKAGDTFSRPDVDLDVRDLYGTGLFSSVRVGDRSTDQGIVLTFLLRDKPRSSDIRQPGEYVSKDRLAFAGYDTPEAALQTAFWARASGNYEMLLFSVGPRTPMGLENQEDLDQDKKDDNPLGGMQILARKVTSEENVELKLKQNFNLRWESGEILTQQMVKVGNEWKLGDGGEYTPAWEQNGTIQVFAR